MRNALSAASNGVDGQEKEDIEALPNGRCANGLLARGPPFTQANPTVDGRDT
jgi:hypothetical protein